MSDRKFLTIKLWVETIDRLDALCAEQGKSRSQVIEKLVEEALWGVTEATPDERAVFPWLKPSTLGEIIPNEPRYPWASEIEGDYGPI